MNSLLVDRLTSWYFTKKALPYWMILLLDCGIAICSFFMSYWLFYRGMALHLNIWKLLHTAFLFTLIDIVFFRAFHTYTGILRYSSFVDLSRIAEAKCSSGIVVVGLHYLTNTFGDKWFVDIRTGVIVCSIIISIALMWVLRILVKSVYDAFNSKGALNVFIYGIQDGGIGLAKMIKNDKPAKFFLRGFISHNPDLKFTYLMGVKVFPVNEDLPATLQDARVNAVLVPSKRVEQFREDTVLQDYILSAGVKIYMSQESQIWDKNAPHKSSLTEVKIEDLLPRQQIMIDLDSMRSELTGKKILITGSAGSIGSEIVRQVALFKPAELMLIDQAETPQHDIRLMMAKEFPEIKAETVTTSIEIAGRMRNIFSTFKPDYVFHAAAYKHVPMMEDNPSSSVENNIMGTKILADLSAEFGVKKFVMVSTDKAVNPTNVMGCSKRICEIYVQSLDKAEKEGKVAGNTQFVTTRFGNVLGSNGSVIPIFKKQIAEGGPVTVTDPNIIRFFMLIPEACKLVLEAGTKGKGGEIFVFDMGKPVRIADLAQRMINLSGAKGVEIKYVGLRDGEKLYEEVLNDQEETKPSFHEKIRIASVREYDYFDVNKKIEELIEIAKEYDPMATVAKMKEIVPEYVSNHSAYSVLDKQ